MFELNSYICAIIINAWLWSVISSYPSRNHTEAAHDAVQRSPGGPSDATAVTVHVSEALAISFITLALSVQYADPHWVAGP